MALKNIFVIGPPGCGKSTQASLLAERMNMYCMESGQILRDYVAAGGPRAAEMDGYLAGGNLVPSDFLIEVLKEKIQAVPADKGLVFNGYIRRLIEAQTVQKLLTEMGRQIDAVFFLKVDKEQTIERISNRRTCEVCKTPFTVGKDVASENAPCPRCGGALARRNDETVEKLQERWREFENETMQSIEYFRAQGLVKEINGMQPIEDVYREIVGYLQD